MTAIPACTVADLDLSNLCREPIFTSQSRQESHRLLARELVEHDLRWSQGAVDTAFFRAAIGRCDVFVLRYGAEVEVRPKPFQDFVLIQTPLRGSAALECDGISLDAEPGQLTVLAPQHDAKLTWRAGCEQLIVKVPKALLRPASAQLAAHGGPTELALLPLFKLEGRHGARGLRLLGELLDQLPANDEGLEENPPWRRQVEESLSMFVLTHQPTTQPVLVDSLQDRKARKVEALMRSRLTETVTLQTLAFECGMSVRSLSNLCQRYYGQAPMERMRTLRLEAARERLLSSPNVTVTEVALDYGFTHLGRFSSYYRERFGELPRQT